MTTTADKSLRDHLGHLLDSGQAHLQFDDAVALYVVVSQRDLEGIVAKRCSDLYRFEMECGTETTKP